MHNAFQALMLFVIIGYCLGCVTFGVVLLIDSVKGFLKANFAGKEGQKWLKSTG